MEFHQHPQDGRRSQRLNSEAAYRFSRGVHPALAEEGVQLGLDRIARWSGGQISEGLVDAYPKKAVDVEVELTPHAVRRLLGIDLSPQEITGLLEKLDFKCRIEGDRVLAVAPPYRLDIGEGVIGQADLVEEIARTYGYNRPANHPPGRASACPKWQSYSGAGGAHQGYPGRPGVAGGDDLPHDHRRARSAPYPIRRTSAETPYVRLLNPITPERNAMRRSLLSSVMEIAERNIRLSERLALFELGQVFLPHLARNCPTSR